MIAASHSGAGKTLVTLGLLRALTRAGHKIKSAKVGPDYIDPAFHARAGNSACVNLDLWSMGGGLVRELAASDNFLLVEGVMGLFDGADDMSGSTADVARHLDLPVILVVNARGQSFSAAALLHGFKTFRPEIRLGGVIFNHVTSPRHAALLKRAALSVDVPVLGCLPPDNELIMPSRHLGLVQAGEQEALDNLIDRAGDWISVHVDLATLLQFQSFDQYADQTPGMAFPLPPLGQRIAIADDAAFSFIYHHLMKTWQADGAEILPFSPLLNEAPDERADAVFLPGGYPELHGAKIAQNLHFIQGLKARAETALIYGECGGFMVLGDGLIDEHGTRHQMAGLLPVTTSFHERKRQLGYRTLSHNSPLPWPTHLKGHEFHYSVLMEQGHGPPLFEAQNALGEILPPMGLQKGRVLGSYAHVIADGARLS